MPSEPSIRFQHVIFLKSAAVERAAVTWRRLTDTWATWSLARQFGTCASLVLLPAMLLIGLWVSGRDMFLVGFGVAAVGYFVGLLLEGHI